MTWTAYQIANLVNEGRSRIDSIEAEHAAALREMGWKYTCDNPGALWLWEKTLPDGRTVLTERDAALHIEHGLQSHG